MSVVLSAMQVALATVRGGKAFEDTSYDFSIASLVAVAGMALVAFLQFCLGVISQMRKSIIAAF